MKQRALPHRRFIDEMPKSHQPLLHLVLTISLFWLVTVAGRLSVLHNITLDIACVPLLQTGNIVVPVAMVIVVLANDKLSATVSN